MSSATSAEPPARQFDALDDDASTDRRRNGGRLAGAPASQDFWAATSIGRGEQSLTWKSHSGRWRLVVMNPDGTASVEAGVAVGARFPHVQAIAFGLIGAALLLGVLAGLLIRVGLRLRVPVQGVAPTF